MKQLYEEKSEETDKTDQLLKSELTEVTERIDALKLFKRREEHRGKNQGIRTGTKIEQLQSQSSKLTKEREAIVADLRETERVALEFQESKIVKYRAEARPLEERKEEVLKE